MRVRIAVMATFTFLASFILVAPASAQFNPLSPVCQTAAAKNTPTCQQNASQNGKTTDPAINIIRTAANIIAVIAGVAAVIIIVISGFMFVTAGGATPGQRAGDPNRIKSARATLVGALIGLVIIALAWTIVTFVTNQLVKT